VVTYGFPQTPSSQAAEQPTALQRRLTHLPDPGNGGWATEQVAAMNRVSDSALSDDFALTELYA
jgi:hypothetical protein